MRAEKAQSLTAFILNSALTGEIIHAFLLSTDFFQNQLFIRVSYGLDPDQARHFVGSDLGPNC